MGATMEPQTRYDVASIMGELYGDGIIACKAAFDREWVARLGEDVDVAFEAALQRPGGRSRSPRTQWDDPAEFEHGMFPPESHYPRYVERAQRKMPKMGDISARSALTVHRGTANKSSKKRPALVLGVDAPDATNAERHDLQFTRQYYASIPAEVKHHLTCRVVDELEPIVQAHTIEGLMMGEASTGFLAHTPLRPSVLPRVRLTYAHEYA